MCGEDNIRKGLRKMHEAFNINLGGDVCSAMADKDAKTRQKCPPNAPYFCATDPQRKGKMTSVLLRVCFHDAANPNMLPYMQMRSCLTFPRFLGEEKAE